MTVRTVAVIAAATRAAICGSAQSANSDGPEPDRPQPSAPASMAARLMAAKPGTSAARRGSGAEALAFERAGDQGFERRVRLEERVDRDDSRRGARRAATEAARERQPFVNAERDAAPLAERVQQRLGRHAGRVARRLARKPPAIARDVVNAHPGWRGARRDLVARRLEREAQHVEAAPDVGDCRRRERGDTSHASIAGRWSG